MKYIDLKGNVSYEDNGQDRFLRSVYGSCLGRVLLQPLIQPGVSKAAGALLDSKLSKCLIKPFIKRNRLDMSAYVQRQYHSYNDFFTREIKPEARMIDYDENHLISPSDGKVSVYDLAEQGCFTVKQTTYRVASLLRDKRLAARYRNGYAVVIRLTVDNYHRYCYPASGQKGVGREIHGVLHTVNPAACGAVPVYKENCREYCLLKTARFGAVLQMEVGAMMVGRICNYHDSGPVEKGAEKGRFEFGGSTIILLLERDRVAIRKPLLANTNRGFETLINMGEWIAEAKASRKNT